MLTKTYNAVLAVYKAQLTALAAGVKVSALARAAAAELTGELMPQNGAQFKDQVKEWKAESAKRASPKNAKAWDYAWSMIGHSILILMRPDVSVKIAADQAPVTAEQCAGNVQFERLANNAIRQALGIARKGGANTKPKTPGGAKAASQAAFVADQAHVRQLVDQLLAMQSGFGLLADALKQHGLVVHKLEVTAPVEEPKPESTPAPAPIPPKAKAKARQAARK